MTRKTNFKGLEIANMSFERKRINCSKEIADSCGTRDCMIEVYKLGKDVIYAGGLCPKGNTSFTGKIAPNYVLIYQNLLNNHLKKYSKNLDEEAKKTRVLIPRCMSFLNEQGVFYTALYHFLGFHVCLSPESNEEISELGKANSHSEFCYPLMLGHGHAVFLKNHKKPEDKILLPDVISCDTKAYNFCPYVQSAANTIMGNLKLRKKEVLIPVIRFEDKKYPITKAVYKDLQRVFPKRFSKKYVARAVSKALKANKEFLNEVYEKGREIMKRLKERKEKIFIGIGRGYTIFDDKASSKVHELFASNGLHFIPSYYFKPEKYDVDEIVGGEMYWFQGRKMLEYTLFAIENNLYPVRLTNFNCGPDSFSHYHEEYLLNKANIPWLVLETDGHNSNAQFGTRIQAHNRVVQKHKGEGEISKVEVTKNQDFFDRIIGVPYMGDTSYAMAAALRFGGLKSEVIPTATDRSLNIAKKIVCTNTCRPFSFQVGDHLAWLEGFKKKKMDPNKKAGIFIPKARGPCRFGQYSTVLRKIFNREGFKGVPIISPSSEKAYSDVGIPGGKVKLMTIAAYKGIVATDFLQNVMLRFRPYEKNKGDTDKIYKKAHGQLLKLVEKNASLKEIQKFLGEKVHEFKEIPKNGEKRRPIVIMNGEIYMRAHHVANDHSVRLLEKNGLEVILESPTNWIDYVNHITLRKALERKDVPLITASFLRRKFMTHICKALFKPLKKVLKGREPHNALHLILKLEPDLKFHHAIAGESGISIGEADAFINDKLPIDGIFHVGPFGCMQETMASSRIQALIQKKQENEKGTARLVPFMDAVFGDSPSPNLESQIAIFAENCKLHRDLRMGEEKEGKNH
jgi:predicted nucleotide-binding protein (sugar kinase/HSP70/actin superfamily)